MSRAAEVAPDITPDITLYALPHSYYSGKVRSYLRYKGIAYRETLSTLNVFRRVIVPRTGVKYIPVIETRDGEFIQDSTVIIDALESRYPQRSVYPETPRQHLAALLLEILGDEWMLMPGMHYRWSFWHEREHIDDVLEHFGLLLSPHAPRWLRRFFGRRACRPFAEALPMLGITNETIPEIEARYERLLDQLNAHFSAHRYLLGERASIGDFGLIGPLYAHLGRDFYPLALMRQRAPQVYAWVQRMNASTPPIGDYVANDTIPETLIPVLRNLFTDYLPILRDTVSRLGQWIDDHPGRRIPRVIGRHRFRLGNIEAERAIFPYAQWMLQRPLDYCAGLPTVPRAAVDDLLHALGDRSALDIHPRHRLHREHNRLVVSDA